MKKRLAVFVSGGGTDFQSVIDGVSSGIINAEIVMCVSSKQGVYALERAKKANIPCYVFQTAYCADREGMFRDISALLEQNRIDYVILAGYLTILPASFVLRFEKRIINIHPALLPKYGGKGYYGMNVHRAVIEAKEKESGCTVHFVDVGVDTGEIIAQARVPVFPDDTPETLQARVLIEEHKLLPLAVKKICD